MIYYKYGEKTKNIKELLDTDIAKILDIGKATVYTNKIHLIREGKIPDINRIEELNDFNYKKK